MSKPSDMDLRDYGRILLRRKWWVIVSLAAGVGLALVINTVTTPMYRATARIQLTPQSDRSPLTGQLMDAPNAHADNLALFTTAELITNRRLVGRAIETLREQHVAINDDDQSPWWSRMFRGRAAAAETAVMPGGRRVTDDDIDWLLQQLSVEPVPDTWLVNVHAVMPSMQTAELVANTIADEFVRSQTSEQTEGASSTVRYLTQQIQEVKQNLQKSEQTSAYVAARNARIAAETKLAAIEAASEGRNLDQAPIQSTNLDNLRRQLLDSETELAKARQVYKDRHPKLVLLESENEAIRASIKSEVGSALAAARADYNVAVANERRLSSGAGNVSTAESDIQNNQSLYNTLVTKLKEAEMTSQQSGPQVQVVEPAAADQVPVRPRKLLNLLVCVFAGLVVGTGLAYLREYLRRTIRTPQDVDEYLQLPVLGLIPKA